MNGGDKGLCCSEGISISFEMKCCVTAGNYSSDDGKTVEQSDGRMSGYNMLATRNERNRLNKNVYMVKVRFT